MNPIEESLRGGAPMSEPVNLPARIPHEPTRTEMMRRFSDKLSMEEIAEFAIWVNSLLAQAPADAPPIEHSLAWKYLDEYFKGRWSGDQLKNLTDLLLTVEADAVAAERERCAKLVCTMCARGIETYTDALGRLVHKDPVGWDYCKAAAIRATPASEPQQCKCYRYEPDRDTRRADIMTGGTGDGWTVKQDCPIHGPAPVPATPSESIIESAWQDGYEEGKLRHFEAGFQSGLKKAVAAERERCAKLEATLNLIHDADMRAIKMWQKAHPGNDNVWPDRANMIFWLLETLDDANEVLRSAYSIAARDGKETNYDAWIKRLENILKKMHGIKYGTEAIRATPASEPQPASEVPDCPCCQGKKVVDNREG